MSPGCSFKSSLKQCRQVDEICLNLPRDARHSDPMSKLKKNNTDGGPRAQRAGTQQRQAGVVGGSM
jgi:hypothetical protein